MRNRYGGEELYSNPTIVSNLHLIQKIENKSNLSGAGLNKSVFDLKRSQLPELKSQLISESQKLDRSVVVIPH